MPNLKRVPGVTATKSKRGRRRTPSRGGLHGWWRVIRFALIVKGIRNRRERSSPGGREIVLAVVTGGIAILIIRGVSRRAMAAKRARAADGAQDQVPETAADQEASEAPTDQGPAASEAQAPEASPEPTTPASHDGLTERVRTEMFENKD